MRVARLRPRARRAAARRGQIFRDPRRASARPPPPPPRRAAKSARASAATGGAADAPQSRLRLGGSGGDAGLCPEIAFCTICVDGPFLVHAPVIVAAPDRIRFHVARGNRAAPAMEGKRASLSCLGPDAYISPDWYGIAGSGADLELSARSRRRGRCAGSTRRSWRTCSTISAPLMRRGSRPSRAGPATR